MKSHRCREIALRTTAQALRGFHFVCMLVRCPRVCAKHPKSLCIFCGGAVQTDGGNLGHYEEGAGQCVGNVSESGFSCFCNLIVSMSHLHCKTAVTVSNESKAESLAVG